MEGAGEFGGKHTEQRAGEQGGRDGVMRPQAWERGERGAFILYGWPPGQASCFQPQGSWKRCHGSPGKHASLVKNTVCKGLSTDPRAALETHSC